MYYWLWKNKLKEMESNDFIGSCEHRLLWLDQLYDNKQKYSLSNLYSKLLKPNNSLFQNNDIIQLKPTNFKFWIIIVINIINSITFKFFL